MKHLQDYIEASNTEILKQNGAFFAFGNKQFEEQKKDGIIYCSLGGGLICPKENATKILKEIEQVHKNGIIQDVEENGAAKIIEREYFNYEMQITWDPSNFHDEINLYKEVFPELFTDSLIKLVCNLCYRKAIDNDWF